MALDEELKEIWKRMEKRKSEMEKINTSSQNETPTTPKSAKIPTIPRPTQTPTVSKLVWTPQKPMTPQKPPVWPPQKTVTPQKPPVKIPTPSKQTESPKIPHPILEVFGTSSSSSANSMFGGMSASNSIFGSTMSTSVSTSATISNPIDEEPIEEEEEPIEEEEEQNSRPITPSEVVDKTPTISSKPAAEMPTIPTKPPQIVDEHQHFRPITPNDQIIGSLWDDINRELEKYKEAKKNQIDPNLSPRSRYGTLETGGGHHSISSYRLQSMTMKRGVSGMNDSTLSTSNASLNDSKLPEKRQRSDSDSVGGGGTKENVDEADGNGSTTSTTLTAEQDFQMKRLREMLNVQQDQICQASRALAFCRQNDLFRGSKEEVDARRALLISTQRGAALRAELKHIYNNRAFSNLNEPKGTLTFKSICVRLNREYVSNYINHPTITNRYHFIVLIKCGEQVFHTTLKSSEDCIKSGFIEFTHHIIISGISPDFICHLEVYSLKSLTDGTAAGRSAHSKKGTWRRMVISTPLNAYTHTFTNNTTGNVHANRPVGELNSGFSIIGKCAITRQLIGREKFSLIDTVYPLDGCLILNMDSYPDQNSVQQCQHRSFLSLYQIISGMGSWNRYWCVLGNGELNFWRYPEDEATKNPTAHLKLSWCISQVTAVPQSTASFPNSMQLDVMEPPRVEGEHKECIRMLFAADTPEERDYWIQGINQAIKNSNLWRSTKQQQNIGTRFPSIQQCQ